MKKTITESSLRAIIRRELRLQLDKKLNEASSPRRRKIQNPEIKTQEEYTKLLKETGEMSMASIKPGGEYYDWAKSIEKAAKLLVKLSKNKFKFKNIQPFDKYQGPYAIGTLNGKFAKLWSIDDDMYYLEVGKNEYAGSIDVIWGAISGDNESITHSNSILNSNR
jgi:hypothetical protein